MIPRLGNVLYWAGSGIANAAELGVWNKDVFQLRLEVLLQAPATRSATGDKCERLIGHRRGIFRGPVLEFVELSRLAL